METTDALVRSYVKHRVLPKHLDVDEEDAVTLVTLLLETRLMDPTEIANPNRRFEFKLVYFECNGPFRTNNNSLRKRITTVRIGGPFSRSWEFHTERVFCLLSKLECMEILRLHNCHSFWFTETISWFPNLKFLDVSCIANDGISIGPPLQETRDVAVAAVVSNLEYVHLGSYTMSEADLATLLFDVFPSLPKLAKFKVFSNSVKNFRGIAERIRKNKCNEARKANNSRLRFLILSCPYGTCITNVSCRTEEDVEAMRTVLLAFRELNDIRGVYGMSDVRRNSFMLHADIAYLMEINFTGRILVEAKEEEQCSLIATTSSSSSPPAATIQSPIPLSLWPKVLARTWKMKGGFIDSKTRDENPDGIYYLLKNVRVLQEGNHSGSSAPTSSSN